MSIVPFKPFDEIERWFDEEWPDLPSKFRSRLRRHVFPEIRAPRMDVYETEKNVVAKVELPGVDPKNIEIEVKDNILSIETRKEEKKEEEKKGYYRKEIATGFFKRTVPLPSEVISEKAEAVYEEGVLKVSIPKKEPGKKKEKPTRVKIKTA